MGFPFGNVRNYSSGLTSVRKGKENHESASDAATISILWSFKYRRTRFVQSLDMVETRFA